MCILALFWSFVKYNWKFLIDKIKDYIGRFWFYHSCGFSDPRFHTLLFFRVIECHLLDALLSYQMH